MGARMKTMMGNKMNNKIDYIITELVDQYTMADGNRPWVIGFSGGKDSTVLLTLVWQALLRLKARKGVLHRRVYVVCNDTLVENPIITNYVNGVLAKIEKAATQSSLPVFVQKTIPRLEDSFWVNVIGKGYPVPNSVFRWCTERLKIKPTARFVEDMLKSEDNARREAIILIGTRRDESKTRAKSIKKHEVKGQRLTNHPLGRGVFVYAPIKELALEEVWYIINAFPSPWGADNKELFAIYSDASADDYECPTMVSDGAHTSCGQSRFGCWTCTVVKQDKSIAAQIANGAGWLAPLRDLRNWIQAERNKPENRSDYRRNGQKASIPNGGTTLFTHRARILEKVLEAQKQLQGMGYAVELITKQELIAIQAIWYRDGCFDRSVSAIYSAVFDENIDIKEPFKAVKKEEELLLAACQNDKKQFDLIQDLLKLQKGKSIMLKQRGRSRVFMDRFDQYLNMQAKK